MSVVSGITVSIGTAHADRDRNSPAAFNARWTTIKSSLEDIIDQLAAGERQATNDSGGTLAVGDLVYRSGYDSANTRIEVKKAIATTANATTFYATHVVTTGGANAAAVQVSKIHILTAQNTAGLTAGRPIFLNTVAGGWTGTLPAANNRIQIVGTVLEVDAATGVVEFDLAFAAPTPFGSADDV